MISTFNNSSSSSNNNNTRQQQQAHHHRINQQPNHLKKRFLINNNKLNYCFSTVNLLVFSLFPCPQNTGKVYLFYAIIIITVLVWLVGWSFSLSISLCTSSQHRSQQPSENQRDTEFLWFLNDFLMNFFWHENERESWTWQTKKQSENLFSIYQSMFSLFNSDPLPLHLSSSDKKLVCLSPKLIVWRSYKSF